MLLEPLDPAARLPWEATTKVETAEKGLPGVSIVIPIYNAGKFLEKTLRSLLCNDLTGVELILMDGGSTDNTAKILAHYQGIFAHCISEKDGGQSDAINKGFARASQPILYWLNGDDVILPNTLNAVRRSFAEHPDTHVVVGDAYMTEIDFAPIRHFTFAPEKLTFDYLLDYASHHLVQPSVFFTRTAWDHAGPVKEDMHYAMDADLFLAMARAYTFRHLAVDIGYSVYHEDCKTRDKRGESITELAMVQASHGGLEQARKTLDILVSLYNDATTTVAEKIEKTIPSGVMQRRIYALEQEAAQNLHRVINTDLKATA